MRSWPWRDLILSVLTAAAAVAAFFAAAPLLGSLRLFPTIPSLVILFWIPILVMAGPFFHWVRRGRRPRIWILVLAACLGLVLLLMADLSTAARLVAVVTDFYDAESTGFFLLFALLCCGGMLVGALIGTFLGRMFPKRYA